MAIETRTTMINSNQYGMITPSPIAAMPLVNRVALLLGPLVTSLTKEADASGWSAFGEVLHGVDADALQKLFMDAVKTGRLCVNNLPIFDPIPFDQHFVNYKSEVYQVCIWCLWECVRDFFPQLEGIAQQAKTAAEKAFQSPPIGA